MKKPYFTNDAEHDPKIIPERREKFGIYNLANVPIMNRRGEMLGCFEIHNKADRVPFDVQDMFMLQGLAASAGVALENARVISKN